MIRFIDLGHQIDIFEEESHFAFYDTMTDSFLSFGGCQVFTSLDDFAEAWDISMGQGRPEDFCGGIHRFINLVPEKFCKSE